MATRLSAKIVLLLAALSAVLNGCAVAQRSDDRSFLIGRDNFSFANGLRWTYEFQPDGSVLTRPTEPPPDFSLRCFLMARAAREFFYHARFEPQSPRVDDARYRELIRLVNQRNSRHPAAPGKSIVIPGYADLFAFSEAYPELVQESVGGAWRSYFQRGNWRMILPVTNFGERRTARQLLNGVREGRLPIVHVYQFPTVRINHAILIYSAEEQADEILFHSYDPNNPSRPAELRFDARSNAFLFERNQYFAGGPVKVYQVYRGWFY